MGKKIINEQNHENIAEGDGFLISHLCLKSIIKFCAICRHVRNYDPFNTIDFQNTSPKTFKETKLAKNKRNYLN